MACYSNLRQPLIIECGVFSFLAPLCIDDVGAQQQEAALGTIAAPFECVAAHNFAAGTLALLCSSSGQIECSVNTALQVQPRACVGTLPLCSLLSTVHVRPFCCVSRHHRSCNERLRCPRSRQRRVFHSSRHQHHNGAHWLTLEIRSLNARVGCGRCHLPNRLEHGAQRLRCVGSSGIFRCRSVGGSSRQRPRVLHAAAARFRFRRQLR